MIYKSITTLAMLFFASVTMAASHQAVPEHLHDFIKQLELSQKDTQGGAIAILDKGQVIYKKTFGYQKGKTGPITSATLFPLASVSKPVSTAALSLLIEKGTLKPNEKFKLPYLKTAISLKDILSHTTGYQLSGNTQIEHGMTRSKLLQKLRYEIPKCQPGGCYKYSNTTFSLVEEALNTKNETLQSAMEAMNKALNINSVQIVPLTNKPIAYPHVKVNKKKVIQTKSLPFPPYYPKAVPAAAGVFASLDGMIEVYKLSFGYRPDLVSKQTLKLLYTPVIANRDVHKWHIKWPAKRNDIESYYGLGWRIVKSKQHPGKEYIFHGGAISGAIAFIGYIPSEEKGIIILINEGSGVTSKSLKSGIAFWSEHLKDAHKKS